MGGNRIWLWLAIVLLALLGAAYAYLHAPLPDDDELHIVALDPADPERAQVGELTYLGGIDIPRMGQNIGGLSGLRWDAESGRLLAITDDAHWAWLTLEEQNGRLTGLAAVESGPLVGLAGETLTGKEMGDSESLTRSVEGGWLIGFERDHRIWRYPSLSVKPVPTGVDPIAILGSLADNGGLEGMAGDETGLTLCGERQADAQAGNCARITDGEAQMFAALPPRELTALGAVPTDLDQAADGTLFVLFRSWSKIDGNTAAIVSLAASGERRELAVLRAPLTVDNFEGLALREEGDATTLYLVSDDNFSGRQRTLLMKFGLRHDAAERTDEISQ